MAPVFFKGGGGEGVKGGVGGESGRMWVGEGGGLSVRERGEKMNVEGEGMGGREKEGVGGERGRMWNGTGGGCVSGRGRVWVGEWMGVNG